MSNRIHVVTSAEKPYPNEKALCFQNAVYLYEDGSMQNGFRFIWKASGGLLAHRGQACIPSLDVLIELVNTHLEKAGEAFRLGRIAHSDK